MRGEGTVRLESLPFDCGLRETPASEAGRAKSKPQEGSLAPLDKISIRPGVSILSVLKI